MPETVDWARAIYHESNEIPVPQATCTTVTQTGPGRPAGPGLTKPSTGRRSRSLTGDRYRRKRYREGTGESGTGTVLLMS